jgi:hypothetical protein
VMLITRVSGKIEQEKTLQKFLNKIEISLK